MRRALALLILLCLPAARTFAAGAGEKALTAGPGLAIAFADGTRAGASLDARFLYGLSDSWSARLGFAGSWLAAAGDHAAGRFVAPAVGMTVAADVLNLVPFGEVGIAMSDVREAGTARQFLGGQLGAGVDYLVSHHLTVSLLGRIDYLALRLAGPAMAKPLALTFAVHLGHVFGP